jgi:NitT/TauT family transport system ATP-binding protein
MNPPPDAPFIRISGVRKVYRRGRQETLAISDATFDVGAGELVSLVGPSGCGKTSLLKILAGLQDYDSGEVRIGSATHAFDPSRDIGMVFQQPLLLKWRRVLQNVLLPAEILGLPLRASRDRARELLAMVGLAGFEDKYPYELSGGMQQRAAIARALIHDPRLILMDEPFGALDALTREQLQHELQQIWARTGVTCIFVTHSVEEAVLLADRVVVMSAGPGRIESDVTVDLRRPRDVSSPEFNTVRRDLARRLTSNLAPTRIRDAQETN